MPSSLFGDLTGGGGGLVEDQRAFQLALELSMLSLGEGLPQSNPLASPLGFAPPPDDRAKKSQNMTECVPVPSSEHVAEIVGRQVEHLGLPVPQPRQADSGARQRAGRVPRTAAPRGPAAPRQAVDVSLHATHADWYKGQLTDAELDALENPPTVKPKSQPSRRKPQRPKAKAVVDEKEEE